MKRLTLIFLIVLSGCSQNKEAVKIALVTTLTGRQSTVGMHSRGGFLLAVEEQNTAGGINGHPIKVYFGDDMGEIETAVQVDEGLIHDDEISFFFGHSTSMFYPVIEEILSRHDVLFFSSTLSTTRLSEKDDLFLRCMPSSKEQAVTLLKLMQYKGFTRTSIIYDDTNIGYSDVIAGILQKECSDYGIEVLKTSTFGDKPEYQEIIDRSLSEKNDSLILICSGYDAGYLGQFAKIKYPSINLVGSEWTKAGEIITHGGIAVEGMLFASAKEVEEDLPEYIEYRDKYSETFNHMPELVSLKAYEGAKILFEGMENADSLTPEEVKKSIIKISDFNGLRGHIHIDKYGDASSTMAVYTLREGEFKLIYLIDSDGLKEYKAE